MRIALTLIALLLPTAMPAGARAQEVHGQIRDRDRGRPIPGARLFLLDAAGTAVDTTIADRGGRFRLAARAAGPHAVHFQMDGWAAVTSERLRLDAGGTTDFDFVVPLVSNAALRQMSEIIAADGRLQQALPELCGEELRPWEAGLLVGVVRARATGEPVAGARVAVLADGAPARSTVSGDHGIYVLCNVPLGPDVEIAIETGDGTVETTRVEIRAGMVSWYDLPVGRRPRR